MNEMLSVFAAEVREQLDAMENGLLTLEQGDHSTETINAVFRAAHTIKGAAGVVDAVSIERFTHTLENVLDRLRNGEISVSSDLISLLLQGCDHLRTLLERFTQGQTQDDPVLESAGETLASTLRRFTTTTPDPAPLPDDTSKPPASEDTAQTDCWHLSIRFGRNVLRNGMDPLAFLRYLQSLGEIVHLSTVLDTLPPAEEMDPEACYLGFELSLRSNATKEEIERVFEFCRDDCELTILPPHSKIDDYIALITERPEDTLKLGEILVETGTLTREELDEGLRKRSAYQGAAGEAPSPRLGETLVEEKVISPETGEATLAKQKHVTDKKAAEARLIRVQADKLDHLIDLVGELVIASASTNLLATKSGQSTLVEATSILSRLVEDIRDSALQLRMVHIGETFNRFHRVVRDAAKALGKEIELTIRGAETELDKSVVEKIGDPLMHLVRNAVDHGIEPTDIRLARGKPKIGHIGLNAYHDSGSIVIEVSDDGGGLPRDKILAKAIERGLVTPTQSLSDQEIINLIFEPGFSTADKITNLSGRGVGLDVVKKNIAALRGTVEVRSTEGKGTIFSIRLPLTLAIIDGFLVGVGEASYVIPLDNVVECLELKPDSVHGNILDLRGEVLPLIRLHDFFGIPNAAQKRESIVVVLAGGQKSGIVVDRLLGEFQTVIKPLGQLFRHLRGISGSTILGSGEVALILDVQALIHLATQIEEHHHLPPSPPSWHANKEYKP